MQFRLTYEGILLGSSRTDTRARHKHEIRRSFHPQLRRLWSLTPHLNSAQNPFPTTEIMINGERLNPPRVSRLEALGDRFVHGDYHFVPLATSDLSLVCGIHVLFLRPDHPGGVIRSGDIDNRLKTLFDALRIPTVGELSGDWAAPAEGENPFFCLLEDDELITQLSVETDTLLQPIGEQSNANDARLVITVTLRPAELGWANISFA
jgi:hypothetical protein